MCDSSGNPLPTDASGLQAAGTPCNKIPSSLINAGAVLYAKTINPAPITTNVPGTNYIDSTPFHRSQNEVSVRIDHQIGSKDAVFFRYTGFHQPQGGSCGIPNTTACIETFSAYQDVGKWTHTFSGNAVVSVGFARVNQVDANVTQFTSAVPGDLYQQMGITPDFVCGFKGLGSKECYFGGMQVAGYDSAGEGNVQDHVTSTYEFRGDLSIIKGRHTLKTGVDITNSGWDHASANDAIAFAAFQTSNLETSEGGSSLASFLLGIPDAANRYNRLGSSHGFNEYGLYFEDQWHATDKLTVNWGLRYDLAIWPRFGKLSDGTAYVGNMYFNGSSGVATYGVAYIPPACSATQPAPCIPGGTLPANVFLVPNHKFFHGSKRDFGPRLGLAYQLTDKWVLRGSWGRFFDEFSGVTQIATNSAGTWPSTGGQQWTNLNRGLPITFFQDPMQGTTGLRNPSPTPFTTLREFWKRL